MNKTLGSKTNPYNLAFEKSPSKTSMNTSSKTLSSTRQIVIKTKQPDIPQITIIKVQRQKQHKISQAIDRLSKLFHQKNLTNLFNSFTKIYANYQSLKLKTLSLNKLSTMIKQKQKRLLIYIWHHIAQQKTMYKSKINTTRLISKLSTVLLNKVKNLAFNKIKHYQPLIFRSPSKPAKTIHQTNMSFETSNPITHQFSQKFISTCKKFNNFKNAALANNNKTQLQSSIANEIQRYKQLRQKKGPSLSNEAVLQLINNLIQVNNHLKNDLQTNTKQLKQLQQNADDLSNYQQIQKQLQKADNQIKQSFEKHKKIQEKQLCKILQPQFKTWDQLKSAPLYNSRLFSTAIMIKLIKDSVTPYNQLIDTLDNILAISTDLKKLQQFKKSKSKEKDKNVSTITTLLNKLIELNKPHPFEMTTITQQKFSENEQTFMAEIKDIKNQIKDFVTKFNNPSQKRKLKKTFQAKRPSSPQQLKDLYSSLNQLVNLVQHNDEQKLKDSKVKKQLISKGDVMMKILIIFKQCLSEGNYTKWQTFITTQVDKQQFRTLLALLDSINDIINEKLTADNSQITKQLQSLKKSQQKIKQQYDSLKNKNKSLQLSRTKQLDTIKLSQSRNKQMEKLIQQWKHKYLQINHHLKQLQTNKKKEVAEILIQLNAKIQQANQCKQAYNKIAIEHDNFERTTKKQLAELNKKNAQLNRQNDKIKSQNKFQKLTKQLTQLTQNLKQKDRSLNQWQQKYNKMNIEHEKVEHTIKKQLAQLTKQLNLKKMQLNQQNEKKRNQHNVQVSIKKQLAQLKQNLQQKQLSLKQWEQKYNMMNTEHDKVQRKIKKQLASLTKQLNQKKAQLNQQNQKIKSQTNNQASIRKQLTQLKQNLQQKQLSLKQWEQKYKKMNIEHDKVERKIKKQLASLTKQVNQKNAQLNQQNQIIKNQNNRQTSIRKQLTQLAQSLQQKERLLKQWQQKYKKMSIEYSSFQLSIKKQLAELTNQLNQKNIQLNQQNQKIPNQSHLESLTKQLTQLKQKLNEKGLLLKQWEQKCNKMNTQFNNLQASLRKQLSSFMQIANTNQKQIKTLKQTNQQKNIDLDKLRKDYNVTLQKSRELSTVINNLMNELQLKNSKITQLQNIGRNSKQQSSPLIRDKTVQHSLQLIKQLNRQLQLLRKSEITIRQLTRSHQNTHYHNLPPSSSSTPPISECAHPSQLTNHSDIISKLSNRINNINSQITNLKTNNSQVKNWLIQKNDQIQKSLRAQSSSDNELNKTTEIKQFSITEKYQQTMHSQKHPHVEPHQIQTLQNALNQLKIKQMRINQLQQNLKNNVQIMRSQKNSNQQYISNLLTHIEKSEELLNKKNQQIKILSQNQIKEKPQTLPTVQSSPSKSQQQQNEKLQFLSQNQRLISQLQHMVSINQHLKQQLSTIPNTTQLFLDNIILLLTNTVINFIKINPKSTYQLNQQLSQQVYNDLINIKINCITTHNQMFINFQQYLLHFIQNDLDKYRQQLTHKIQQLTTLKTRLLQFINTQNKYSIPSILPFQSYKSSSTTDGNIITSPINYLQTTPVNNKKIAYQFKQQLNQQILSAKQLF